MESWFVDPQNGDYHLTGNGPIDAVGMWVDGDPVLDIDGETRPTTRPSFPGYDEPM